MERNQALVILILLIYFFFPQGGAGPDHSKETNESIARQRAAVELLRNSTFGPPLANFTGLLPAPHVTPPRAVREHWAHIRTEIVQRFLPPWKEGVPQEMPAFVTVYRNATGSVSGDWAKVALPELPNTSFKNVTYAHNFSDLPSGSLSMSVEDSTEKDSVALGVGEVKVTMRIRDKEGRNMAELALNGVHFLCSGFMVAATTSERFAGLFALPHFMLYETEYNQSKKLLLPALEETVGRMERTHYMDAPWLLGVDGAALSPQPQCEYIVYVQLHPISLPGYDEGAETYDTIEAIEREMRFPTGSSLPAPPQLVASVMAYSPNCGFVLVADQLEGEKLEPFYSHASHLGLGSAVVATVQVWLLIRQMNESNTLSTISRVSLWTLIMMAVVDGYFFFSFMVVAVYLRACFLPMVTASFCYLMLSAMFGMRFVGITYRVQRQAMPTASAAATTPPDGLPAPATAAATIIPPTQANTTITDEVVNAEVGSLHARFYLALIGILFFTLQAATWPLFLRNILLNIVILATNSYWLPQIHRNVMRGCRKALQWEFVFGSSICRLSSVLYVFLYSGNIFRVERDLRVIAVVVGWVGLQCLVLLSQDVLGPRFLVPLRGLPVVYDYHCPLNGDEEVGQVMGTPIDGGRRRGFDCVVCMQAVEVPTRRDSEGGARGGGSVGMMARRGYMVTPCRHVFHSHCLEGWMRFRLQCPICRNPLPAL